MKNRREREQYLKLDDTLAKEISKMLKERNMSLEEIAEYCVNQRNLNKLGPRSDMDNKGRTLIEMRNIAKYGNLEMTPDERKEISKSVDSIYTQVLTYFKNKKIIPTDAQVNEECLKIMSNKVNISYIQGKKSALGPSLEFLVYNKSKLFSKQNVDFSREDVLKLIIENSSRANDELNILLGLRQIKLKVD